MLGVTALDGDAGVNGRITYTLTGADAQLFLIDANTGVITARNTLVGRPQGYSLGVKAVDNVSRSIGSKYSHSYSNSRLGHGLGSSTKLKHQKKHLPCVA